MAHKNVPKFGTISPS